MRIDRLRLQNFRNLKDFEIDFDESSVRQVVVGRNGVGKSNVLEALTWIFRDLDLEEDSHFEFEIEYHCNKHYVKVISTQTNKKECALSSRVPPQFKRTYASSEEELSTGDRTDRPYRSLSETEFYRKNRANAKGPNPQRLLPLYVFGYYSGLNARYASIFAKHEERYYREQITGEEAPLRPLFQAKPHHSQFALLAFYATRDRSAEKFLAHEFRIAKFDSVLFALREPYWYGARKNKLNWKGDPRFWGAGGKVQPFLDALFSNSLAPMASKGRVQLSVGQTKTKERRYCFVASEKDLQGLAQGLGNKEFFARLDSLVFSDLAGPLGDEVTVWIQLKGASEPTTFQDMAEGERQLLTVLGLMRFTAGTEALFLLDEPDTHLNPAWCLDYLDNLREYGAEPPNSQIIMTTHSPLTFAGLDRTEVVVMERDHNGHISASHPVHAPRGMGFAAILTSDFFGLRSILDNSTLAKLDEKRELGFKVQKTDDERERLTLLNEELGRLDFSVAARDPLYLEFIRAITAEQTAHPEIAQPNPDKATWQERKAIARDIALRLLQR
jgi:predicted ATPase